METADSGIKALAFVFTIQIAVITIAPVIWFTCGLPQALEALNKKDLGEIKAYTNPPELVETVMQAVMILRQSEPSWAEAKKQLGDTNFIKQLVDFDKENMTDKVIGCDTASHCRVRG